MSIFTASVEYSSDGGKTFQILRANYTGSLDYSGLNLLALNENKKNVIIRTFPSGSPASASNYTYFYIGGMQMEFSSYYTVNEHKYMCVVKKGEFNRTTNVTLYDTSGSLIPTPFIQYDTSGSIIKFEMDNNFTPYATSIGLYDENNKLVAYAKFAKPIKIEKDFDSVFIVKFDI